MAEQNQSIDFSVDKNNLYREEGITDFKVASIRMLTPIKVDGSKDESRSPVFIGTTQIMSPQGPVPIQEEIKAASLEEAIDAFPAAMDKGLQQMMEQVKKMQQQEAEKNDSRIIMPGM